jgi:hypothetical protein
MQTYGVSIRKISSIEQQKTLHMYKFQSPLCIVKDAQNMLQELGLRPVSVAKDDEIFLYRI